MNGYFQTLKPLSQLVRPWPYPFKGGLSIANDAEFMSFEYFETLMAFLNGKEETPLGRGLGMNVTSSFFFYSTHSYNFSYFSDIKMTGNKQSYANRLEDYLRSGWIDTIHAYGDFDGIGGFRREHAQNCYQVLDEIRAPIEVFTNHGSSDNIQNVGADAVYHQGDLKKELAYHSDLMKENGIRYIWTDSMVTQKGDLLEKKIVRKYIRRVINYIKRSGERQTARLIFSERLQDGAKFKGFMRFRSTGVNAPNLSSLGAQLEQIDWRLFYAYSGAIIIYQHLGVLYRSARRCVEAKIECLLSRPEIFMAPFYRLEKEMKEGRLWICGLAAFLRYVEMVESTQIILEDKGIYVLEGSLNGKTPVEHFQGLTLYVEANNEIELKYKKTKLNIVNNGPDDTGQYSVSVPFIEKSNIWT